MERQPKFEIGQSVKLNNDSPEMKIAEAIEANVFSGSTQRGLPRLIRAFTGNYKCQWFVGNDLRDGIFPEESLIKV